MRKLAAAVAALTIVAVPTYANAAIATFAQYNQVNTGRDLVFRAAAGTALGGTLSSRVGNGSPAGGLTAVLFDFLVSGNDGATIAPIASTFSFTASTTSAVTTSGSIAILGGFSGSFDFISTTAFTINGIDYAVGTDLLKGVFTDASLVGTIGGTSGGVFDSGPGNTLNISNIVYSSAVADFTNDESNDLSLTLTSVTPVFKVTAGKLANFSATGTGSFSSDPTPTLAGATPEMATWGMMVMGFGLIGGTIRSRRVGAGIRLPVRQAEFA